MLMSELLERMRVGRGARRELSGHSDQDLIQFTESGNLSGPMNSTVCRVLRERGYVRSQDDRRWVRPEEYLNPPEDSEVVNRAPQPVPRTDMLNRGASWVPHAEVVAHWDTHGGSS